MNRTLLLVFLVLGITNFAHGQANGFCNLVWSDEFNGNTLSSDWHKEITCNGGGNNEMQCYTPRDKNVFMNNGNLVLRAYREDYTGTNVGCTDSWGCTNFKTYTSGRVNTAGSRSWQYGRFETRAKLPSGYQLWPAIWMLPSEWKYGGWAASGEIDIMESRGNDPTKVSGTLHHGGQWPQNIWTTTGDKQLWNNRGQAIDLSDDFHVYTLEWTRDSLTWYIDNTQTQQISLHRWFNSSAPNVYSAMGQPFDQKFFFILNLAVGGGFFGNDAPVQDWQSAQWKQPEMRVDYVRVYQQGGNCNGAPTQNSQAADNNARPTQATPNTNTPGMCNGQGYDANSYTCTTNERGQQVLCSGTNSVQSCGSACFSTNQYCCNNGNLQPAGSCPVAQTSQQTSAAPTSAAPTSAAPTSAAPTNNNNNNRPGTCNGQGYDSNAYTCTINNVGNQVLCSVGMASCGTACYNSDLYCCNSNGGLDQKGACGVQNVPTTRTSVAPTSAAQTPVTPTSSPATGEAAGMCNGQGFDTSAYTCTRNEANRKVLCPISNLSCGNSCYNPEQYCCKSGSLASKSQC